MQDPQTDPDDSLRRQAELTAQFKALVLQWSPVINLVSKASLADLETRHIADSLQLCQHVPADVRRWCDLGSGGGFPALLVAIHFAAHDRALDMHCIESDARKATFLREAARQLHLPVTVHTARIDQVPPVKADVVSARALAALPALCGMVARHLRPGGLAILPKGASYQAEVTEARHGWQFDLDRVDSQTDPAAAILILRNLVHVG